MLSAAAACCLNIKLDLMTGDIDAARYLRSTLQGPHPFKDSEAWGHFVRYIELGDDGYALRQVDEYANGYLSRYDRTHWDDQFGMLADFQYGPKWLEHWGQPVAIARAEFEDKWRRAAESPAMALKQPSPLKPPPWIAA